MSYVHAYYTNKIVFKPILCTGSVPVDKHKLFHRKVKERRHGEWRAGKVWTDFGIGIRQQIKNSYFTGSSLSLNNHSSVKLNLMKCSSFVFYGKGFYSILSHNLGRSSGHHR